MPREELVRKTLEKIKYGAECLASNNKACAECPIHKTGIHYPLCLNEIGKMILDVESGDITGLIGLSLREKVSEINRLENEVKELRMEKADTLKWIESTMKRYEGMDCFASAYEALGRLYALIKSA